LRGKHDLLLQVTLTTEEWKAEQQLFLGQGEERTNHASRPTHQQAVPVNFLLRVGHLTWGAATKRYICEQPSMDNIGQQLGLDRTSTIEHSRCSTRAVSILLWMASLILAQDKRWRRA
jgi:hypothetical protein